MKLALFEGCSVLFQPPYGHLACSARGNRNNDVRKRRPRMVQIVLRGTRRVIGMRMIEAEQLEAKLGGSPFSQSVV
jgi:hypothetical protein